MSTIDELVRLSRAIGRPEEECVILGEGNTSARNGENTFYVKASGANLSTIDREGFVEVRFEPILGLLEETDPSADTVRKTYEEAKVDHSSQRRPSVETAFHAVCLSLDGVGFVAHTHATAVNKLCCAAGFPENLKGRIYPDEIVWLGTEAVYLPYVDPGVPLAKLVRDEIDRHCDRLGLPPRAIYLQNHGLVALGATRGDAESTTFTAVKAAEIRLGALQAGGLHLMPDDEARRIAGRPDEAYRKKVAQE